MVCLAQVLLGEHGAERRLYACLNESLDSGDSRDEFGNFGECLRGTLGGDGGHAPLAERPPFLTVDNAVDNARQLWIMTVSCG